MTLIVVTPPSSEPVSLAEAKLALRFSGAALDSEIDAAMVALATAAGDATPYSLQRASLAGFLFPTSA